MALQSLELENFRQYEKKDYTLFPKNLVVGSNGSGKSSIKEAIAFVLTGTDSIGTRNPQHLIRKGTDSNSSMKVTLTTDKAVISRSLSKKGNSTLKVIRDNIPTKLTQKQFESMVGSTDIVLSSLIPGYFNHLPMEKKHQIIGELQAEIDREALFEELAGFSLSSEEKMRYGINRRLDLVAKDVASDKREAEKTLSHKKGELTKLTEIQPMEKPQEPPEVALVGRLQTLEKEWSEYNTKLKAFQNYKAKYDRIIRDNQEKENERRRVQSEIERLKEVSVPEFDEDFSSQIEELENAKKEKPQKPAFLDLPQSDYCPTCGQAVGLKHREKVKKENEKKKAEYEQQLKEVEEHNERIQTQINEVYKRQKAKQDEIDAIKKENEEVRRKKQSLQIKLASITDEALPDYMEEPEAPSETFDKQKLERAEQVVTRYRTKLAQYEYVQDQVQQAEEQKKEVEKDIENLKERVNRLQKIEEVFKKMPQEELRRQAEQFKMDTVSFEIGNNIRIFKDGFPYELLSTGAQMRADIEISKKFNDLMKRPMNVIFVDNVDLLDKFMAEGTSIQWFAAKIEPEIKIAEVHEITK